MNASEFWSRVTKGHGPNDCWFYVTNRSRGSWFSSVYSKYPATVRFDGKGVNCPKFAYILAVGPVPEGLVVRHRCANGGCCNPEHLLLGTQKENMLDMVVRNRFKIQPGVLATYEDLL